MYKLLLCLRYLRTRYIALASIISVMLGVATMIVVNSVMAGFGTEMRDRIHGILADVIVEARSSDGIRDAEFQMQQVREIAGEYIEAMTPIVEVYAMLSIPYAGEYLPVPVTLIGIQPEGKARVGPLIEYLDSYNQVIENGKVVREALRSGDEDPDWDLTSDASEYRRSSMELSRISVRDASSTAPLHNDVSDDKPDPTDASAASGAAPDFDDTDSMSFDPFRNSTPQVSGDDLGLDSTEHEFAPCAARLYVGHSIISWNDNSPEPGATQTVYMARPGDDVMVTTVSAGRPEPARFNATIVDSFKSGMSEYDMHFVFMNLEELQRIRGMDTENSITSIQIKLKDYTTAPTVVRLLEASFPRNMVRIGTWEDKQGPLLEAVQVEAAILNVLLFLIIAVAGFGILAIFFMIVVEKTRDIGILKALGAGSGGVMSIFLAYGLALGMVGSGIGVVLGLLFVRYINEIENALTWLTGQKVFDEQIYYFFEIPTRVNPLMVFWVAFGAMTIAVLASIFPARRAARLHPVQALRFE